VPAVYISWPFCGQKCTYCNFASGVFSRDLEERYRHALRSEIEAHQWGWVPETLYLGGGTPSGIDPDSLRAVFSTIPGRPWREATLEAAPGTITREGARLWREAGINRISLGVQSFVPGELAGTGRKHNAETVAAEIAIPARHPPVGASRWTGSNASRPDTSPCICWRLTRTAGWGVSC